MCVTFREYVRVEFRDDVQVDAALFAPMKENVIAVFATPLFGL